MKRDNKQSGFCFGDLELFAAETAQVASSAPASNESEDKQAEPIKPASACPLCGKPLDSNGLITWCENAHVYYES